MLRLVGNVLPVRSAQVLRTLRSHLRILRTLLRRLLRREVSVLAPIAWGTTYLTVTELSAGALAGAVRTALS